MASPPELLLSHNGNGTIITVLAYTDIIRTSFSGKGHTNVVGDARACMIVPQVHYEARAAIGDFTVSPERWTQWQRVNKKENPHANTNLISTDRIFPLTEVGLQQALGEMLVGDELAAALAVRAGVRAALEDDMSGSLSCEQGHCVNGGGVAPARGDVAYVWGEDGNYYLAKIIEAYADKTCDVEYFVDGEVDENVHPHRVALNVFNFAVAALN